MKPFSRRGFLKGLGVGAGALVGTRLAGSSLVGEARAATPIQSTIIVVYLDGGFNNIFTGADALMGSAGNFGGVTANNATQVGPGGPVIDNTIFNAIPAALRTKTAAIGIRHGISDHGNAQRSNFMVGTASAFLTIADAMGGTGAIKAATLGNATLPNGQRPAPVGTASLQQITDMRATIDAIAGATPAANVADRNGTLKGVVASHNASKPTIEKHKQSLSSVDQGFTSLAATLAKPIIPFNAAQFNTDYGLNGATNVNNFRSRMAAAELMARAGANIVIAQDGGWDTHGDTQGNNVRNMMGTRIVPGLTPIFNFMVQSAAERNVTLVMFGDFNRSMPGSDHQANLTALVIGNNIKNGTTARTATGTVGLAATTPSIPGLWQMLSSAVKLDVSPFGANPHTAVVA
jgi:hypothetical protein